MTYNNDITNIFKLNSIDNSSFDYLISSNFNVQNIKIKQIKKKENKFFIKRKFQINYNNQIKVLCHYDFKNWKDDEIPEIEFSEWENIFEKIQTLSRILVHCKAGIGRTGTFLALFIIYNLIVDKKLKNISIFKIVRILREQRWSMVNNTKQYQYLYNFLNYLKNKFHLIDNLN